MIFATQPPTRDPSSRWISSYGQDVMHACTYSPQSPSSSPEGFYSIPHYTKMQTDLQSSWSTYPYQPCKARPVATVNPRAIIPPFQTPSTSDVETPSSASSHSVSTPLSPFVHLGIREEEYDNDEFEFEYDDDDDDDCVDSDFLEDIEMSEEDPGQLPLNGLSAPQVMKSAVLGDQSETAAPPFDGLHHGTDPSFVRVISDRKTSASAPGYPSTSHHSLAADEELQRWLQGEQPPDPTASFPGTSVIYPSQHLYNHPEFSPSPAPAPPTALHQQPSYVFSGAITSTDPSNTSGPIPIMQPQPIRPIPHIPLDEFTSNNAGSGLSCGKPLSPERLGTLSPLPLLCQPVSDAVRYQLDGSSANPPVDDPGYYDDEDMSEGVCENILADAPEPFPCEQDHPASAVGTCSVDGVLYWYGNKMALIDHVRLK
ncbi:hypothetical protein J3A83DRAFT_4372760 [Scleroderma citrinum]